MDTILFCVSIASTWVVVNLVRFTHKGRDVGKIRKRMLAYGIRFALSALAYIVPLVTLNINWATLCVVVLAVLLFAVDFYSRATHELRHGVSSVSSSLASIVSDHEHTTSHLSAAPTHNSVDPPTASQTTSYVRFEDKEPPHV